MADRSKPIHAERIQTDGSDENPQIDFGGIYQERTSAWIRTMKPRLGGGSIELKDDPPRPDIHHSGCELNSAASQTQPQSRPVEMEADTARGRLNEAEVPLPRLD
jgi:hypothetical protein